MFSWDISDTINAGEMKFLPRSSFYIIWDSKTDIGQPFEKD